MEGTPGAGGGDQHGAADPHGAEEAVEAPTGAGAGSAPRSVTRRTKPAAVTTTSTPSTTPSRAAAWLRRRTRMYPSGRSALGFARKPRGSNTMESLFPTPGPIRAAAPSMQ
ncbi:MAG: hypothetical protein ACK559_10810, partial [bacterium]